jgi:hypothetical protein
MTFFFNKLNLRPLCFLSFALCTEIAQAAFYIQEPTLNVTHSQSIEVPFYIGRFQLGKKGTKVMQELLEKAYQADRITITGYSDPSHKIALSRLRAHTLQRWLINQGISPEQITLQEKNEVRAGQNAQVFNCLITFHPSSRAQDQSVELADKPKENAPPAVNSSAPLEDPVKLAILKNLITLGQNKVIKADEVLVLVSSLLKNEEPSTLSKPVTPPLSVSPSFMPSQFAVESDIERIWTLSHNKTLRENLEEWAQIANWQTPRWESTHNYTITFSSTIKGTFLQLLNEVANAVPEIDLRVSKSQRFFSITDAKQ